MHAFCRARRAVSLVPMLALSALAATTALAQTGTISGHVTSAASGEPLPSVTVRVANTTLGGMSDASGRYTIAGVPVGAQIVFAQRIGFGRDTARVVVTDGATVTADFSLRAVATTLATVEVNVGYGTQERRNVTGAVSSVTSEQISTQPVQSVDQALLGRAAGVQVTTASGQPGAGAAVRIRGGNSISAGNDPLYVIDGVPVTSDVNQTNTNTLMTQGARGVNPLSLINPDDIESIDILKDASATSIYGARAANGVILITTKAGRRRGNTISLGAYVGTAEVRHKLDLLNAQEFATNVNQAYIAGGAPAPYSAAQIAAFGRGTDWQSAIFRTAPVQNYDLAFSGGDTTTRFYLSGALLNQQGIVIGTDLKRGSVRLNLDRDISSRFRIGNRLTLSRSDGSILPNGGNGQEVSSVLLNAILAPPTIPVYNSGGEYNTEFNFLTGRPFSNPVATALGITNTETDARAIGNLFGEYDFIPGLTLRSSIGGDYLNSTQNFYSPNYTLPGRNFGGQGSRGQLAATTWLNENTLHFTRGFADIHTLDLLGGLTFQRSNTENVSGTAQGFNTDRLGTNGLNQAQTFVGVFTGEPHSSLLSYFTRANYTLLDRYLFTLSGRVDGSSKFGAGNRYAFFPAAAFAWRASDESFIKALGWFDDLKLRTSYGRTGNQDIGNYAALARLNATVYPFVGSRGIGFVPAGLPNPDLKWESTRQYDVGLDVGVFGNRLSFNADYYDKKTSDLLLDVPIPRTSGTGSVLKNIGAVANKGAELTVNTVNLTGPFTWNSQLNLAWNRNKVLQLGASNQIIGLGGVGAGANQDPTLLQVGQPTNSFYGFVYAGKDANGAVQYADLNGDGKVNRDDRTILGNAQPNYIGGFNNDFGWNRLQLSVFLQWSVGNKIYNINRAILTQNAGNTNQLRDVLGNGYGIPAPKTGNTFDTSPSNLFVESGSYLRGKNIRLSYAIPGVWLTQAHVGHVDNLRVYVSAQNFFTSTKYSGYDPELNEYSSSNLAQGFDFGTYPQPRQITFGFNAGF
ncbi:MAG: SusC/RagA family TonB-linked outer membrane protein [Gemmatimonadaceae bacterium]